MSSKRYNKLEFKKELNGSSFSNILNEIKKNCTAKFEESIDISFQINNKQKKI